MVPMVFEGCRAWLHPAPAGKASARGIILCSAFGLEELCSRKSLRLLADAMAARGCPVLRFDWSGTADSAGDGTEPGRVEAWLRNIAQARAALIAATGVKDITIGGFRLGALLALEAARKGDGLLLLAPPLSGKHFVREAQITARLYANTLTDTGFAGLEIAGFRIAQTTLDAISRLAPVASAGTQMLIAAPDDASALASGLCENTANVRCVDFAGYEAMMCDPTASVVPLATLQAIADAACENAAPALAFPAMLLPSIIEGPRWREDAAAFGENARLSGIFCVPAHSAAPVQTVIFVNAGGVHHIGWARMFVDMARSLAATGVASLRIDLSGVGDSLATSSQSGTQLYDGALRGDISAAIDWLYARGHKDIALYGSCSGAYQAFHAAVADPRIRKIALVNQLCFIYGPTQALQLAAWRRTKAADIGLRRRAADFPPGTVPVPRLRAKTFAIAKRIVRNALRMAGGVQSSLRTHVLRRNPVERWFEDLTQRGTSVLLIYSAGDPGLAELDRHMGSDGARATALPNVERQLINNADHELTQRHAREAVDHALSEFLRRAA